MVGKRALESLSADFQSATLPFKLPAHIDMPYETPTTGMRPIFIYIPHLVITINFRRNRRSGSMAIRAVAGTLAWNRTTNRTLEESCYFHLTTRAYNKRQTYLPALFLAFLASSSAMA